MKTTQWMTALTCLVLAPWMVAAQTPAAQAPAAQAPAKAPAKAAAAPQQADGTIPPDQRASKEEIAKLIQAMHLREQIDKTMTAVTGMVENQIHARMQAMEAGLPNHQKLTPAQQAALEKLAGNYMLKAMKIYPTDEMMEDANEVYRRHMSRADVEAYIAFYNSPAGQHLLVEQPIMTREFMTLAMSRLKDRRSELFADLSKDMKAYIASQTGGAQPAAKGKN